MKRIYAETIRPPTASCHAGTLAWHGGTLHIGWFGGPCEGHPDTRIYLRIGGDVLKVGNPAVRGVGSAGMAAWNPVLVSYGDKLLLFFKVGEFCDRWQTFLAELGPDHKAPARARMLEAGYNGPVRSKPLIMGDTLICGSSVETPFRWASYIELMDNLGGRPVCRRSNDIVMGSGSSGKGLIQPSPWSDTSGRFHALMRSATGDGRTWYSSTYDPLKWPAAMPTDIPNPNSGLDTLYFDGKTYVIYNDSTYRRVKLTIAELDMSGDLPVLTDNKLLLREDAYGAAPDDGSHMTAEVSYPYAIMAPDGRADIICTVGRTELEYCRIEL